MTPICFDNLTLGYDRHPAVHHLSGEIAPGSLLAVVGPNGAGKSTLLKAIAGILPPLGGNVAGPPARALAYLPQMADLDRSFPISVYDLVALGLWRGRGLLRGFGTSEKARIAQALEEVGLRGFERRAIGTLSGGQLQRALFARILLEDAPVILLDEPFAAIDTATTGDLLDLIEGWHKEGRTVVAVLHDMDLVRAHFTETLLLAREAVAWGRTANVLTRENLQNARTMVEAGDPHAPICRVAAE